MRTRLGFIYSKIYPKGSSHSVHGYFVAKELVKRGWDLQVFKGEAPYLARSIDQNWPIWKRYKEFITNNEIFYIRYSNTFRSKIPILVIKIFKPNAPIILEINAPSEEQFAWSYSSIVRLQVALLNLVGKITCRFVDGAIVVSNIMKQYVQNYLRIKHVIAIPNGGVTSRQAPNFPVVRDTVFNVLWIGDGRNPWQDIELINEVAIALSGYEDIRFHFVGDIPQSRKIQSKNVQYTKRIPFEAIADIIMQADICLALFKPYSWCKLGFYGSPLKLFEYLSFGKFVLASPMGQILEVIKDKENGFLVENDIVKVAEKILLLKDNRSIFQNISKKALQTIADYYNWERVGLETSKFLEKFC